ncbi:hypothetical protein ACET3Z_026495 [Daucus carota]
MSHSREIDPLLKDQSERKQSFRHNVVMLAASLRRLGAAFPLKNSHLFERISQDRFGLTFACKENTQMENMLKF